MVSSAHIILQDFIPLVGANSFNQLTLTMNSRVSALHIGHGMIALFLPILGAQRIMPFNSINPDG